MWVSEIMLQQTQVATVIDYYLRFTEKFPDVQSLAAAHEDEVLALWSGLGYYSRARNLHRSAQMVVNEFGGKFPEDYRELQKLPGVGSYTAGAIMAFAYSKPAPVVDGNIARVFSRLFVDETVWGDGPAKKHFEALSFQYASQVENVLLWQEGLMELGALICKPSSPDCSACPFKLQCKAYAENRQDEFPRMLAKPEKTRLDMYCTLRYDHEHIWLEKNHGERLFGGLYAPPLCEPFNMAQAVSVQRTLTHRNLHLHAKLEPMCSEKNPSPHWIKRSALGKVGMSAAVKTLLKKAALLMLLSGCSVKSPSIRYVTRLAPVKAVQKQDPFEYARSLMGQTQAVLDGKKYRSDCSGTVKAIYDAAGWSLGGVEGTDDIYKYVQKSGKLDTKTPKAGDLVFFHEGGNNRLAHVGFVESILPDQTILFIHQMNGIIVRSRMNLTSPNLQMDPKTGSRLNHILRRGGKKGYTAAQLFVAFGRVS